MEVVWVQL